MHGQRSRAVCQKIGSLCHHEFIAEATRLINPPGCAQMNPLLIHSHSTFVDFLGIPTFFRCAARFCYENTAYSDTQSFRLVRYALYKYHPFVLYFLPSLTIPKMSQPALGPLVSADLTGRVVIVTGANTGLGLAASKHLATMNPAKLIMTVRSAEKGEKALQGIVPSRYYAPVC